MSVLVNLHEAHKERLARIEAAAVDKPQPILMLSRIIATVARYYMVPRVEILSSRRTEKVVIPRQVAMYLCRKLTTRSLPEIGRALGGKDHTTVLYGVGKIEREMKESVDLAAQVHELTRMIEEEFSAPDWKELEASVEHACQAAFTVARDLEGYRRHGGARRFLKTPERMEKLEQARDYISRVYDDMRGVK